MATQSLLQHEVAELRKELAAARAELHRLRAVDTQRDPDAALD
jgi:ribosomal protein L29